MSTWTEKAVELAQLLDRKVNERNGIDKEIDRHVADLRREGLTWSQLGMLLGTSSQAAWERYSELGQLSRQRARVSRMASLYDQAVLELGEPAKLAPERKVQAGQKRTRKPKKA
jgi:hypothetical protein